MTALKIRRLTKVFSGTKAAAVYDLTLEVARGEVLAILGESGCGKTTVLRMIAGFEMPSSGEIWLNGKLVCSNQSFTEPERREVGIVFQDYALFPHMTVMENIVFGLFRLSKQLQQEKAREVVELTGLTGLEQRYPHQLSGGQKQRVALARALTPGPEIILFDEPFSNVDTALRKQIRYDISRIIRSTGVTAIFVTHDVRDVMNLADRLVVMRAGSVMQEGPPAEVQAKPANDYVAGFFE